MVGLLGPNGAGKTTLFKLLATALPLQTGDIASAELDYRTTPVHTVRTRIGYLPQRFELMEWSTVRRNVEYAAWAHGVADADIAQRADESLERVGLLDRRGSRARSLSGGMRPRLGLACALAHSPELTTLDEPTVGLDPVQRAELRHQIAEHGREGVVVVVAQFRQSMPAWAVLAGWIGVCVARVHQPQSIIVGPTPALPRATIVTRQLSSIMGAVAVGTLIGGAPAAALALATVPGDWTDVVAFSTLLAAQASLVALGACVAIPLGIRTGFFVVPALFLALVLLPAFVINDILLRNQPFSVMALSYMWSLSIPQPGTTLAMSTEFIRLLFYTLVIVVAIAAAAGLAEARAAGNRRAALATCWFLLPLAVSVIIATIMPVLGQRDTENGVRCTDHPGFRLCLYPNDERGRRFVAESVAVIADPLPACEPCRPSPSLRSTSPQSNRPTSSTGSAPPEPTGFRSSIETVRASTSARRADHRRRSRATPSSKAFFTVLVKRAAQRHPEVSEIVGSELSPNVDEQALQAFPRLDDQAFIAWYRAHQSQFFDCTISKKDLP